jgi:hypothetical protein
MLDLLLTSEVLSGVAGGGLTNTNKVKSNANRTGR